MDITDKDIARFWSHVDKSGECWTWNMSHDSHGYGHFCINSKTIRAHRIAYVISYGSIPDRMEICHHCDNPGCVRPEHLFAGTHTDNMHDAVSKGRAALQRHPELRQGERHPLHKLTEEQVLQIRHSHGVSQDKLALQYGVSRRMIRRILARIAWKHI